MKEQEAKFFLSCCLLLKAIQSGFQLPSLHSVTSQTVTLSTAADVLAHFFGETLFCFCDTYSMGFLFCCMQIP